MSQKPQRMPLGYRFVVAQGLAGFEPFTPLCPWYFLKESEQFDATKKWPSGPSDTPLLAFARNQENDDIACFEIRAGEPGAVALVNGWTRGGESYSLVERYPTFWDWMKSVLDDIAEVSERPGALEDTEARKRSGES